MKLNEVQIRDIIKKELLKEQFKPGKKWSVKNLDIDEMIGEFEDTFGELGYNSENLKLNINITNTGIESFKIDYHILKL